MFTEEELYILNQALQTDAVVIVKSTGQTGLVLSQHMTFFNYKYLTVELDDTIEDIWEDDLVWVGRLD